MAAGQCKELHSNSKSKGSGTYNQAYLQEETCSSRWRVLYRVPVATTLPLAESTGKKNSIQIRDRDGDQARRQGELQGAHVSSPFGMYVFSIMMYIVSSSAEVTIDSIFSLPPHTLPLCRHALLL